MKQLMKKQMSTTITYYDSDELMLLYKVENKLFQITL